MNENKLKIKRNLLMKSLSQILMLVFGLLMPRITLVSYGSEVNGLLNSVTQIVSYLALFEAGIQAVAKKSLYCTVSQGDNKGTNGILSAVNKNYRLIGFIYFGCLISLSLVYPMLTKNSSIPYSTVFWVVFFSGIGNVITFFVGGKYQILLAVDGKEYIINLLSTIVYVIGHLVKMVLLLRKVDIEIIMISTWLISCIQVVGVWLYIRKSYPWIDLNEVPNKASLRQSGYAFGHQISMQIFANIDVLLLTIFCDLKIVSVYSIYKMLTYYLRTILVIPIDSTKFAMGQLFNKDKAEYIKILDTLEVALSIIVYSVYAVTLYLILPFIKIYTASITDVQYIDKYLPILFVLGEMLNIIRFPMSGTINFAGHFKQTLWRSIFETVINVSVSLVGVIYLGIYGVLLGTIAALMYRTVDIFIYANTRILNRRPFKTLFIYSSHTILMLIIAYILHYIPVQINNYVQFFCVGLIVTPVVFVIFTVISGILFPKEHKIIFQLLKNR